MTDQPDTPLSPKALAQRRSPFQRAQADPKNIKLAVAAFCYGCQDMGTGNPHLTKARVRDCPTTECPLHPHRGWQTITTPNTQ